MDQIYNVEMYYFCAYKTTSYKLSNKTKQVSWASCSGVSRHLTIYKREFINNIISCFINLLNRRLAHNNLGEKLVKLMQKSPVSSLKMVKNRYKKRQFPTCYDRNISAVYGWLPNPPFFCKDFYFYSTRYLVSDFYSAN